MGAYTLDEINAERAEVKAAIAKALKAQLYKSGDDSVERARLKELRDHLAWLDQEEAKLAGSSGLGSIQMELIR
jgi:hypothetical protein